MKFILTYLAFINLLGFAAMHRDKRLAQHTASAPGRRSLYGKKARKRAFRIPEAALFRIALMGGSAGSLLGMYAFRHKTKHLSFVLGMPVILIVQLLVLFAVLLLLSGEPPGSFQAFLVHSKAAGSLAHYRPTPLQ